MCYPQVIHVESQYATYMRDIGITSVDVVINHAKMCDDPLNCFTGVPEILPRDSVMRV
ncbi:DddA-like double-stranded DNA deaminase toxin [Streptomyces lavendulae]|uniref:DddA-like double-stranded DNA deaminase toxin n=1 Tax=Streptomyces lavendulae TaxID=1914 RepID=UPI00340DE8BA